MAAFSPFATVHMNYRHYRKRSLLASITATVAVGSIFHLESFSSNMLVLLERFISWTQRLKRLRTAVRRHTEDRKRRASPPIQRREEISKREICLKAPCTNPALPLIVVTDVDGKLAAPDSW
jgi:hypothetical protein